MQHFPSVLKPFLSLEICLFSVILILLKVDMSNLWVKHKTEILRDFPCGPMVKTVLPLQEACTPSPDTELRSRRPHGAAKKSTEGSKGMFWGLRMEVGEGEAINQQ